MKTMSHVWLQKVQNKGFIIEVSNGLWLGHSMSHINFFIAKLQSLF